MRDLQRIVLRGSSTEPSRLQEGLGRVRRRRPVAVSGTVFLVLVSSLVSSLAIVEGFSPACTASVYFWGTERKQKRSLESALESSAQSRADDEEGDSLNESDSMEFSSEQQRLKRTEDGFSVNNGAVNITINEAPPLSATESELLNRVSRLEQLVAKQSVELKRLQQECVDLTHAADAFARVIELLRESGLQTTDSDGELIAGRRTSGGGDDQDVMGQKSSGSSAAGNTVVESFDDALIFGKAPANVIDAADVAGASILAGILGGKQRMLVDVRDADLSSDPETLVQFIELAILPVAAGLEGLLSKRNRLKIVFPTVSQLMHYRKTMALAAPEVVALSTLGFDPVEDKDNLVVILAPAPDDEEGHRAMNALLRLDQQGSPSASSGNTTSGVRTRPIQQPVVVLNHHMMPINGPAANFEVAYHLRLLSVQYMSGGSPQEYLSQFPESSEEITSDSPLPDDDTIDTPTTAKNASALQTDDEGAKDKDALDEDEALEAAMEHAHQAGMHHGMTRAMVVRAFPRPWHVFVDTSPDTDADFEVAATFDDEPTQDQVNLAIVECLEGSEQEDELVAKQMQQALETGQLDRVSEMLGGLGLEVFDDDDDDDLDDDDDDDDDDDQAWDLFQEDSV